MSVTSRRRGEDDEVRVIVHPLFTYSTSDNYSVTNQIDVMESSSESGALMIGTHRGIGKWNFDVQQQQSHYQQQQHQQQQQNPYERLANTRPSKGTILIDDHHFLVRSNSVILRSLRHDSSQSVERVLTNFNPSNVVIRVWREEFSSAEPLIVVEGSNETAQVWCLDDSRGVLRTLHPVEDIFENGLYSRRTKCHNKLDIRNYFDDDRTLVGLNTFSSFKGCSSAQ